MIKSDYLPPGKLNHGDAARLTGCEQEHKVFEKLQLTLAKKRVQDTVIISSWSDKGAQDRKNREIDVIILSLRLKSIFQIEVKKSYHLKSLNDGVRQLKEGKTFLSSVIPFPSNEQWKFVRSLCFGKLLEPLKSCKICENFLLSNETNLEDWWDSIDTDQPAEPKQQPGINTYLMVLKYLLFQMFLQDDHITRGWNISWLSGPQKY